MIFILARCLAALVLFCAPIVIYIILSGKAESLLYLILPLVAAVPAIILALVLFWPVEMVLDRMGHPAWKNILIPIIGGTLIFVFTLVLGLYGGNLEELLQRIASKPDGSRVTTIWVMLGVGWGIAWRASEWLARTIGTANG